MFCMFSLQRSTSFGYYLENDHARVANTLDSDLVLLRMTLMVSFEFCVCFSADLGFNSTSHG